MNEFSLELVPHHRYDSILTRLEKYLPHSILAHGEINIRKKYGPLKHAVMSVYVPQNEKYDSLVFTCTKLNKKRFLALYPFWDVNQITKQVLWEFIQQIPNLSEQALVFYGSPRELLDQLNEVIQDVRELFPMKLVQDEHTYAHLMVLPSPPKEIARAPDGYVVEKLKPDQGKIIMNKSMYPFLETEENMADRISKLSGWGAFKISTEGKQLVAWTIRYSDGAIGMTHTLPQHRRKGLAAIITLSLAQEIFSNGERPWLGTVFEEEYNLKFHQKLGFEVVSSLCWQNYVPSNTKIEDWT